MSEASPGGRIHRLENVRPVSGASPYAAGSSVEAADDEAGALRRLLSAVGSLYERAVDAVLATPHEVTVHSDALALLDGSRGGEGELRDQIAKVALIATPIIRRMEVARRFTRVPGVKRLPFVMSVTTVASVGAALGRGVRDVQVIGSYVASRLREVSGVDPDPELVKRLTVQLYLSPGTMPRVDQRVGPAKLLRRWLVRGALGRDGRKQAERAVSAVTRLDVDRVLAAWIATGPH